MNNIVSWSLETAKDYTVLPLLPAQTFAPLSSSSLATGRFPASIAICGGVIGLQQSRSAPWSRSASMIQSTFAISSRFIGSIVLQAANMVEIVDFDDDYRSFSL